LQGGNDLGVTVPGRANGNTGVAVEKDVSVRVRDPHAGSVIGDELIIRPRVTGRHILGVSVYDLK